MDVNIVEVSTEVDHFSDQVLLSFSASIVQRSLTIIILIVDSTPTLD